jgi:hypothetical protein
MGNKARAVDRMLARSHRAAFDVHGNQIGCGDFVILVEEHSASEGSYPTAFEAFEAGAVCWRTAMNDEDENADPVVFDEPEAS